MKKKIFTLLTLLVAVCSGAWAEQYFSAIAIKKSYSISASTTTEMSSDYVTVSGGTLYAVNTDTNEKDFTSQQSSYLCFLLGGSKTGLKIVLSQALAIGDVISVDVLTNGSGSSNDRGIFVTTATSRPNSATCTLTGHSETGKEYVNSTYTVASEDGLVGETTIYVWRQTGNNTYFKDFTITTPAPTCTDVAAPTALTCSATTCTSLTYTWTKATNATGYTATLYSDSECTSSVSSQELGDVATVTFSGLGASSIYYCKVQSKGDGSTYCEEGGVTAAVSGTTTSGAYTVSTASNNNDWGTATATSGTLDASESTTITANATDGYKFVSWDVSGEGATLSSTTTNPTTLTIGSANVTVTATFRALETYTITYNAGVNGTGTVAAGEKTEDTDFTLSSSKFTRDGYDQFGWSTTDGGAKVYELGGTYTTNATLTLYPYWEALDALASVSSATTWDWSEYGTAEIKLTDATNPTKTDDFVLSNIDKYGYSAPAAAFGPAQSIKLQTEYVVRDSEFAQGGFVYLNVTVPGTLAVTYSNTGNRSEENQRRYLNVNGTNYGDGTMNADEVTTTVPVNAGDITIKGTLKGDGSNQYLRFYKIVFTPVSSVPKTMTDAGWATYCSPYALDFSSSIDNLTKAYIITGASGSTLTLSPITGKVAANTGILLEGTAGTINIPTAASGTDYSSTNKLVGVTAATAKDAESIYVLMSETAGVGFYSNNNAFTVGANTAYLPSDFAGAREFYLFEGETTGINEELRMKNEESVFFDLQGRRVAQPTKGLYIVNGKKVVIK